MTIRKGYKMNTYFATRACRVVSGCYSTNGKFHIANGVNTNFVFTGFFWINHRIKTDVCPELELFLPRGWLDINHDYLGKDSII